MKIFIASDHAAIDQKEMIMKELAEGPYEVVDLGPDSTESVHYPNFAENLCEKVLSEDSRGILLCGSGIGMSIAANRFKGIRATLCKDTIDAKLSREHNDSNVLVLGARTTSELMQVEVLKVWLHTKAEEGRHAERRALLDELGK